MAKLESSAAHCVKIEKNNENRKKEQTQYENDRNGENELRALLQAIQRTPAYTSTQNWIFLWFLATIVAIGTNKEATGTSFG